LPQNGDDRRPFGHAPFDGFYPYHSGNTDLEELRDLIAKELPDVEVRLPFREGESL
jgi:hypothetical protein